MQSDLAEVFENVLRDYVVWVVEVFPLSSGGFMPVAFVILATQYHRKMRSLFSKLRKQEFFAVA